MFYSIMGTDHPNSLDNRLSVRAEHLERLQQLANAGKLLLAGPHPAIDNDNPGQAGFTGSLIVAEFNDLKAAQDWANDDPYVTAGVFKEVTVKPFKKVLP